MANIKIQKKLIEVALPLDDINAACAREKNIRHGHPSTLHLWWARRPLAAARAVLFAQMVNDPGGERGWTGKKTKAQAELERDALFDIIRDLVKWENTTNEEVLERAREAIRHSWRETCALNKGKPGFDPEKLPAFHDPFAGGGAIPLEAQRLGLESYASDLNPVAVMINKAMIEIPPRFAGQEPVGPIPKGEQAPDVLMEWDGAKGLAEDVRRYGHWMREEAIKRIGHLYPKITAVQQKDGAFRHATADDHASKLEELTVIAWLWARTVKSPNPAFSHVDVPLVSSYVLSSKKGKEAWVEPIIEGDTYRFKIRYDKPPADAKNGTKLGRGANFKCVMSDSPVEPKYIKDAGVNGRLGQKLLAVVCEGKRGRIFMEPVAEMEALAMDASPDWKPTTPLPNDLRNFWTINYGLTTYGDLFTDRQLVALGTFSDLVSEAREKIKTDALASGMSHGLSLASGGNGAQAFAEAVSVYLGFSINKMADRGSSICSWDSSRSSTRNTFGRQAIPMTWDFAEANPLSDSTGNFLGGISWAVSVLKNFSFANFGEVTQQDAAAQSISAEKVVSTDPPYYDNIGYADLSDFFYVWMRRALRPVYPELFATMAVPKAEELVATPYRHGGKEQAETFFMDGMTRAMHNLAEQAHPAFPVTIYYAFKQSDTAIDGTASTGWETFLESVIRAGFSIDGTWPMRTEMANKVIGINANILASSIVLVCQKRPTDASTASRKAFLKELREVMPDALETMIGGESGRSPIAPVDLAQAAIGPGIAVFSKYAAVLNQDGSTMSVHDALILINRAITDHLHPEAGSSDADTLFCSEWFDNYGWSTGVFGDAITLAQAKGTTVDGVQEAGVIESGGGKVRLLKWEEYPADWDPKQDNRTPIWEACHHMIRTLKQLGETSSGELLAKMPERGEPIRQLAYHLYTLCERKGWAEDARAYNELITSWSAIVAASIERGHINEQIELI